MRLPYPESLQLLKPDDTLKNTAKNTEHPTNDSRVSTIHATAVAASAEQPPELDHARVNPQHRAPLKRKGGSVSMEPDPRSAKHKTKPRKNR